jgi:hypothetical protein
MPESAWITILLFVLTCIAGMTDMHYHTQLLIEMGFHELFSQAVLNLSPPDLCLPNK